MMVLELWRWMSGGVKMSGWRRKGGGNKKMKEKLKGNELQKRKMCVGKKGMCVRVRERNKRRKRKKWDGR